MNGTSSFHRGATTLDTEDGEASQQDPPLQVPSPALIVYPNSDVSSTTTTDTDDSDSLQHPPRTDSRVNGVESHSWRDGESLSPAASDHQSERWPPLPDKPRLTQKFAVIKKVRYNI